MDSEDAQHEGFGIAGSREISTPWTVQRLMEIAAPVPIMSSLRPGAFRCASTPRGIPRGCRVEELKGRPGRAPRAMFPSRLREKRSWRHDPHWT